LSSALPLAGDQARGTQKAHGYRALPPEFATHADYLAQSAGLTVTRPDSERVCRKCHPKGVQSLKARAVAALNAPSVTRRAARQGAPTFVAPQPTPAASVLGKRRGREVTADGGMPLIPSKRERKQAGLLPSSQPLSTPTAAATRPRTFRSSTVNLSTLSRGELLVRARQLSTKLKVAARSVAAWQSSSR